MLSWQLVKKKAIYWTHLFIVLLGLQTRNGGIFERTRIAGGQVSEGIGTIQLFMGQFASFRLVAGLGSVLLVVACACHFFQESLAGL